ncbi:response regulator [Planctomycetota bacterium]
MRKQGEKMPSQYYTTGEIAKICDVSANGVIKWIKAGKLKAFKTPGGQRRIREEDVVEFVGKFNYPVDPNQFRKSRSKPRVLIVDDDPDIITILTKYFEHDRKYEVQSARGGYEACIKAGSFIPDIMILDILMPKVDGFQVITEINGNPETKKIKIIILSALEREIILGKLDRFLPVLTKPLDLKDLGAAVDKVLMASKF